MTAWPKDNQDARNAFYGDPGAGEIASQMVPVVPPFAMYYEGKRVKALQFHRLAAPALLAALNEIWDYCQHDQARIDAAGVSKYNGAYNPRKVRGSTTKWSNHAYAAAIDLDADNNKMGVKKGKMPEFVVDAFCRQGAMWGGWYKARPDWMHFEFVDNGGRKPKSAPPIFGQPLGLAQLPPADEFEDEPPAAAPGQLNVQPVTAEYDVAVEVVQAQLDALGFREVGEADGYWGGKTAGAIKAFFNDRGIDARAEMGPVLNAEISKAKAEGWTRPVAPERANATPKGLAPKVESVRISLWGRFTAKIAAGAAALGLTGSGVSDTFSTVKTQLQPVQDVFNHVPGTVWCLIVLVVAGTVWYVTDKAAKAATNDYKTGRLA